MISTPPQVCLNDGRHLPRLGFGTWRLNDDESCSSVRTALAAGYRLIDTATRYENEVGAGHGIAASGVPRSSIVATTTLHDADHGFDRALRAFDASAARLAHRHRRSPAQILLRWHIELGLAPVPKSGNPARITENLDIFGFALDAEDLRTLATLDGDHRQGEHPDRHLAF